MSRGRVYVWTPEPARGLYGRLTASVEPLLHLDVDTEEPSRLSGRFVCVRNGGAVYERDPSGAGARARAVSLGDAQPDSAGNYLFEPGRGGGRIDKITLAEADFRRRYIQAARFGEVNTYFHLDRIGAYVRELLRELGAPPLPRATAVVNAHHAATEEDGIRDGVKGRNHWLPFQGGHYRLPSGSYQMREFTPIASDGEIHLGPGWQLLEHGALVDAAGGRYRANASHNAGIVYHEYGHHITRHTADFCANALRPADRQSNRKTAMDEGTCDYWAATMLGTPHIWILHRRHDDHEIHTRSLTSRKTMADFVSGPQADVHTNGTIWGAALWDLRTQLSATEQDGVRKTDLLVLKALLLIGKLYPRWEEMTVGSVRLARKDFQVGLTALLLSDELLYGGQHRQVLLEIFSKRGICPAASFRPGRSGEFFVEMVAAYQLNIAQEKPGRKEVERVSMANGANIVVSARNVSSSAPASSLDALLKHVSADDIPASRDVLSKRLLEEQISIREEPPSSVIAVGDIMLGGRATKTISEYGPDYPFDSVLPLLRTAPIVVGNLEGPFARTARKQRRKFSYRVDPDLASSLTRAGINVVTLANNHLFDCGRAGVLETLDALARARVSALGAGPDNRAAHAPVIRQAGRLRIGLLGYYWNRRTAATADQPGSAMDPPEALESDIRELRKHVDRIVVNFHWGVPYEREPSPEDRAKAHFAVDCGADAVIGHHPHIVQPFEIYRGCPIFYSVGNFAFGSGNSRAESLLVAVRFEEKNTFVNVYPLYVKNRDPRVDYQPKVLTGKAAERVLFELAKLSGPSAAFMELESGRGTMELPWTSESFKSSGNSHG